MPYKLLISTMVVEHSHINSYFPNEQAKLHRNSKRIKQFMQKNDMFDCKGGSLDRIYVKPKLLSQNPNHIDNSDNQICNHPNCLENLHQNNRNKRKISFSDDNEILGTSSVSIEYQDASFLTDRVRKRTKKLFQPKKATRTNDHSKRSINYSHLKYRLGPKSPRNKYGLKTKYWMDRNIIDPKKMRKRRRRRRPRKKYVPKKYRRQRPSNLMYFWIEIRSGVRFFTKRISRILPLTTKQKQKNTSDSQLSKKLKNLAKRVTTLTNPKKLFNSRKLKSSLSKTLRTISQNSNKSNTSKDLIKPEFKPHSTVLKNVIFTEKNQVQINYPCGCIILENEWTYKCPGLLQHEEEERERQRLLKLQQEALRKAKNADGGSDSGDGDNADGASGDENELGNELVQGRRKWVDFFIRFSFFF